MMIMSLPWIFRVSEVGQKSAKLKALFDVTKKSLQCAGAAAAACTSRSAKDSTARDPGHQKTCR